MEQSESKYTPISPKDGKRGIEGGENESPKPEKTPPRELPTLVRDALLEDGREDELVDEIISARAAPQEVAEAPASGEDG